MPKEAGEVGISLPPLSDATLEAALTQKRAEVRAALAAGARCHASWYGDDVYPALEVSNAVLYDRRGQKGREGVERDGERDGQRD